MFKKVLGNKPAKAALRSILKSKHRPQAFMFTGPSGCGKTTLARILALKLKILEDNYHEFNSANFRGIDTSRRIVSQLGFAPMGGGYSMWLLDESHKMTNDAQNALLKVIEEPPAHATIVFCTTEPNKMIKTIRTRCTIIEVAPLDADDLEKLIIDTAKSEKTEIPEAVQTELIEMAEGSPRMVLSLMESIISLKPEEMLSTLENTQTAEKTAIELCRALMAKKQWKQIAEILRTIEIEPETLRRSIIGYAAAILLKGADNAHAYVILDAFREHTYDTGKPGLVAQCYEACDECRNTK